jgi:D-alanyl-lipoteichoic acid acyltransferase DltB (MBOAT superfamily)
MLFTDPLFLLFLSLVVSANFLTRQNQTFHRWLLLLASWVFFYLCSPPSFLIFLLSAAVNYPLLRALSAMTPSHRNRVLLLLTVGLNLGLLAYFKYTYFFESWFARMDHHNFWLPLAISFYTVHIISYAIDLSEKKYAIAKPLDYFNYLSFFPHLLAGPIVRGNQLIPQFEAPVARRAFDWSGGISVRSRLLFQNACRQDRGCNGSVLGRWSAAAHGDCTLAPGDSLLGTDFRRLRRVFIHGDGHCQAARI